MECCIFYLFIEVGIEIVWFAPMFVLTDVKTVLNYSPHVVCASMQAWHYFVSLVLVLIIDKWVKLCLVTNETYFCI
jgi:hypothetical protein